MMVYNMVFCSQDTKTVSTRGVSEQRAYNLHFSGIAIRDRKTRFWVMLRTCSCYFVDQRLMQYWRYRI